jgi:O-acetyl-ADP-ribose deacetylase (regulator of RNase III)
MSLDTITYIKGDATAPKRKPAIIAHVVNDCGRWGSGFVLAVSKRWKQPEKIYKAETSRVLNSVSFVEVAKDVTVANMTAQHGIFSPGDRDHNNQPLVYDALYRCLLKVAQQAKEKGAELHMPKIGSGLAKGDWKIIEAIIDSACREHSVKANVYTL